MVLRSFCLGAAALLLLSRNGACLAQDRTASTANTLTELRAGFKDPPASARLRCYWWWLNGNTNKPTITHDLEEMKAKGIGGVLLVDADGSNQTGNSEVPRGPTFGSPAWIELYTHALREADRLGLEVTLNITSGWNLGGPQVTPEQASKLLTWTRTQVQGGSRITLRPPAPERKNGFYRQIAVLAYPLGRGDQLAPQPGNLSARSAAAETGFSMPDSSAMLNPGPVGRADTALAGVQNLTARLNSAGILAWDPPPGRWEILRIGYTDSDARVSTASGAWQGLAIDYLDHTAFDKYWEATVDPLLTAAKPFHSLKYLATDSWELGGTNWTGNFHEQFKKLRGYDPIPWLPVVAGRIVGSADESTRFLTDLRRTVADLVVTEHYDVFAAHAAAHGLGVQAESGGPHGAPIDALETFRHSAIPQTEFWSQNPHRHSDSERFFTKEGASAAHIYGQRLVAQEGETSIGPQWSESLATDLKPSFDMAITEGMNRLVWHEFTSSHDPTALPGQEYFAGTHLNPKITWWNAAPAFFAYLNRVQFVMQQGTPVSDLLYFYGDNVPNFVRLKGEDPAHVLPGYDYDVTNEDALLHTIDTAGGRLRGPGGVEWKALAIPSTRRISLAILERIEAYVREGGTVIGAPPEATTGQVGSVTATTFQTLTAKVWGSCQSAPHHAYGKGQVFCSPDAHAALQAMKIPQDLDAADLDASSTGELDYIHRRLPDFELYFLRNGSATAKQHDLIFRTDRKLPELWDPITGDVTALPSQTLPDGRVRTSVDLPAFGSAVLVFGAQTKTGGPRTTTALPITVLTPWTINFQPGRGAPAAPLQTTELKNWTDSADPGIRFFSGTATYRTTIDAPKTAGKGLWLRFGDIHEIATVRINGKSLGTVWAKPLMIRVDQAIKPGHNSLEIEVTNLWPNRIIGDLQPGVTRRFTNTNITAYTAESPLLPSGLTGPLQWIIEQ